MLCLASFAAENLACTLDSAGKPKWWSTSGNARVSAPGGNLRITIDGPGHASLRIPVKPGWKFLKLSAYIQTEQLVPGEQSWQNGRLAMRFYNAKNEAVGPWPDVFGFSGNTPERKCERLYPIPSGAAYLLFTPSNFGKSGKVEFSRLRLEAVTGSEPVDKGSGKQPVAENLACTLDPAGKPKWWSANGNARVSAPGGNLRITIDGPGHASLRIPVKPGWKFLKLSAYIQTEQLVPGEQSWQNGRLAMRFYNAKNEAVGPWPDVFGFSGNTPERKCVRLYPIPAGAAYLLFTPSNFGKSGKVEFSRIHVEAVSNPDALDKDAESPSTSTEAALWSLDDAARKTNPLRESVSLNGLWRFHPSDAAAPPARGSGWGWFKVPGIWPGRYGWLAAESSQKIHLSPLASPCDPARLNTAWYRRKIAVPAAWKNRKIELEITMLQTCAQVFVDGKPAGEFYYPGGRIDLTSVLTPGRSHELALRVSAIPDEGAKQVFMAPGRLIDTTGELNCRGITGDVFLHSVPVAGHITDAHLIPLLRDRKLAVDAGLDGVAPGRYFLEAEIRDGNRREILFRSADFTVKAGEPMPRRIRFEAAYVAPKLWDIDTPQNLYFADIRLRNQAGETVDQLFPQEFGYREFRIEGRNFLLNGTPIHLRSLVNNTIRQGAEMSCAIRQKNLVERAKRAGFNHLIGYDYDFAPGTVGYIDAFYREASRAGVLTSLTMPHAKDFHWKLDDPAEAERYRQQAESLIRRFQNLPGVVLYAMNHNATGYFGDQNPQKLDGIYSPDERMKTEDPRRRDLQRKQALLAAEIVHRLDPSRPVYHHESGNLGEIFSLNCYLNWVPRQERSDWFEEWEARGTKPLMLVEWGMPHTASWSSFRGPAFIWSSPAVQWVWLNEFNAEILGETAYRMDDAKISLYRLEEKLCRGNRPVLYSQLHRMGGSTDPDRVRAWMTSANFREMRARGISGLLPWDQSLLWRRGAKGKFPVFEPFDDLKKPGIVPDFLWNAGSQMIESFDAFEPSGTGAGALPALKELTGWIAGKPGEFTEKGHNFRPGESVRKQLLVLNDTRRMQKVACSWRIPALKLSGSATLEVAPGTRAAAPLEFSIPASAPAGRVELQADFQFADGSRVRDLFPIDIIAKRAELPRGKVGLYDPEGSAAPLFAELGLPFRPVRTQADLDGLDLLVIGRRGLKNFPLRLSGALRAGMRLLVLEQEYPELVRLGFRANIHGLRTVFPLDGGEPLHDWRGSATLVPPVLETPELEISDPSWSWNGFDNTRPWRAGHRGTVNTVLLEKPSIGDFLPLYLGGFDLQYAPVLEWNNRVIFSQLDLAGRTESDPEAVELLRRLLLRLDRRSEVRKLPVFYAGDGRGAELLRQLGIRFAPPPSPLPDSGVLVLGPGAELNGVADAVRRGLFVLSVGLNQRELERHFAGNFRAKQGKFFSDYVPGLSRTPEFAGLSNAELHWRTELAMAAFDAASPGGRALSLYRDGKGKAVALQIAPWMFDEKEQAFRTTRRRTQFLLSRLLHNLGAAPEADGFELLDGNRANGWELPLRTGWIGKADPQNLGRAQQWFQPEFALDSSWKQVQVPGNFEDQFDELKEYDGLFWYRLTFDLPEEPLSGRDYMLRLGVIDDESWVWVNDHFAGELTSRTNPVDHWSADRSYRIPAKALKRRGNVLTVLCNDLHLKGGILGKPVLQSPAVRPLYADLPRPVDDPYRYYRW